MVLEGKTSLDLSFSVVSGEVSLVVVKNLEPTLLEPHLWGLVSGLSHRSHHIPGCGHELAGQGGSVVLEGDAPG